MSKLFLAYKMFEKQRTDTLIDNQRKAEIQKHNEQVNKNREIILQVQLVGPVYFEFTLYIWDKRASV